MNILVRCKPIQTKLATDQIKEVRKLVGACTLAGLKVLPDAPF
jgi:hypothetical protein